MRIVLPIRAILPLALAAGVSGGSAQGQGGALPANPPTATPVLAMGTAGPVAASGSASRKADIEYTDGVLKISANNSSLNQILREVSRLTGMKITGGVAEDRVFGSYGPAPADRVLASLLDGTASNVLIVQGANAEPAELILTPRKGDPTPPAPNSFSSDADPDRDLPQSNLPPQQDRADQPTSSRRSLSPNGLGPLPPSNGGQTGHPADGGANLGTTPGAFQPYGQSPPDATAQPVVQDNTQTTAPVEQPDAAHGTITPQQIYEQLQRLQQQQQQTTPPAAPE